MGYYADIGPIAGPLNHADAPDTTVVLEAPDSPMPIGMAFRVGGNAAGVALWTLSVHGAGLTGDWVIVDRKFVRAQ